MPGCVVDIDAYVDYVDSDGGRIRFQDFERSRLCLDLSGSVISDHGSEYCNTAKTAKTAKYVLRCYTCQLFGMCVLGVFRGIPAGLGGWVLVWVTHDWAGGFFFLFFFWVLVLVLVLVLGSGLVISHCVMISRCSLPRGLCRRTFGYTVHVLVAISLLKSLFGMTIFFSLKCLRSLLCSIIRNINCNSVITSQAFWITS